MPRIVKALVDSGNGNYTTEGELGVIAVERAIRLLQSFRAGESYVGLTELSSRAQLNKATALRIVRTLGAMRWLVQNEDGAWRLGPGAGELGSRYQATFDVDDVVKPLLRSLSSRTGESASFFVREGEVRTCVARVEGPLEDRGSVRMGAVYPLNRGSPGRVILAFSGEPGEIYERIRRAGFAISIGERASGGASVSAPVFGANRRLLGAISVAGSEARLTEALLESHATVVVRAAQRLSYNLGAQRGSRTASKQQRWHP